MVVAAKKAVGSEYMYQTPIQQPKQKNVVRVRISKKTSPMLGVVCGIMMITVLFSMGLSYTYIQAIKAKTHFNVAQLQQSNQDIIMQNEKLKLEIARLKSLDRIEEIAALNMGMIKNPEVQYLALQNETSEVSQNVDDTIGMQASQDLGENVSAGQKIIQGIVAAITERTPVEKG